MKKENASEMSESKKNGNFPNMGIWRGTQKVQMKGRKFDKLGVSPRKESAPSPLAALAKEQMENARSAGDEGNSSTIKGDSTGKKADLPFFMGFRPEKDNDLLSLTERGHYSWSKANGLGESKVLIDQLKTNKKKKQQQFKESHIISLKLTKDEMHKEPFPEIPLEMPDGILDEKEIRRKMIKKEGRQNSFDLVSLLKNEETGEIGESELATGSPERNIGRHVLIDFFTKKVKARHHSSSSSVFGGRSRKEKSLLAASLVFPDSNPRKKLNEEKQKVFWLGGTSQRLSVLSGIGKTSGFKDASSPTRLQKALRTSIMKTSESGNHHTIFMRILSRETIKSEKPLITRQRNVSIKKKENFIKENAGFSSIPETVRIRACSIKSNLSSLRKTEEDEKDRASKKKHHEEQSLNAITTPSYFTEKKRLSGELNGLESLKMTSSGSIIPDFCIESSKCRVYPGSEPYLDDLSYLASKKCQNKSLQSASIFKSRRETAPIVSSSTSTLAKKEKNLRITSSALKSSSIAEIYSSILKKKQQKSPKANSNEPSQQERRSPKKKAKKKKEQVLSVYTKRAPRTAHKTPSALFRLKPNPFF